MKPLNNNSSPAGTPGTQDLASLLSLLPSGGTPSVGSSLTQNDLLLAQSAASSLLQHSNSNAALTLPLLQTLLALNQPQPQSRNTTSELLSILAAQELSQTNPGARLTSLASPGILGNLPPQNLLTGGQEGLTNEGAPPIDQIPSQGQEALKSEATLAGPNMGEMVVPIVRNLEPGAIAVPCRARGMPMDHNPLTAYFVLKDNVKHGDDVICSHATCRNGGIKFRYCSYCKAPVAKRNFRRRHNHGEEATDGSDDESARGATGSATSRDRSDEPERLERKIKRAKVIAKDNSEVQSSVDGGTGATKPSESLIEARRTKWAKLLDERPSSNDANAMSAWMNKVLEVSNPTT